MVLHTITGPPCVSNGCSYLCFSQVVHRLGHRQSLHVCAQITTSENTGRGFLADFWNFLWVATCSTLYCLTNPNDLDLPEFSALSSGSSWVLLSQSHLEILLRHCVSEAVVDLNVFTSSWGSLVFIVKCPVSWAGEMRKCSELWEMGNKLRPEFVTHSTEQKDQAWFHVTPALKSRDEPISRAHPAVRLVESANFLFSRRPCLIATTHRGIEETPALGSTCVHTYSCTHPYMNHTMLGAYFLGDPCFCQLGWKWKALLH